MGPAPPALGMPAPWGQVRQSWGWDRQSRERGALSRRQPRRAAGGPARPLLCLFTDWLAPQEAPENPWPEKAIQISQAARGVGRPCRTKGGQPRRWGGWSARGRCTAGGHSAAEQEVDKHWSICFPHRTLTLQSPLSERSRLEITGTLDITGQWAGWLWELKHKRFKPCS